MFFLGDLFNKENVVLIFLAARTSSTTVGDDGKNVEHAEKDTKTSTKNESDGSTLPFTEEREGDQETLSEGGPVQEPEGSVSMRTGVMRAVVVVGTMFVVMFMVVFMMGTFMVGRFIMVMVRAGMREVGDLVVLIGTSRHVLDHDWVSTDERKDMEFLFFNLLVLVWVIHFNGGQSKRLPESVGELDCLHAETGPAHSTTRLLLPFLDTTAALDQCSDVLIVSLVSRETETSWDGGNLLANGDHFDTDWGSGDESGTSHESRNKGQSHLYL
jgi:hypothetical protein